MKTASYNRIALYSLDYHEAWLTRHFERFGVFGNLSYGVAYGCNQGGGTLWRQPPTRHTRTSIVRDWQGQTLMGSLATV